jgi:hypothetical protein
MSAAYDEAMAILNELIALEPKIMAVVDPGMSALAQDALYTLKNVLSTAFGSQAVTPEAIDQAAHTALDVKFPKE